LKPAGVSGRLFCKADNIEQSPVVNIGKNAASARFSDLPTTSTLLNEGFFTENFLFE